MALEAPLLVGLGSALGVLLMIALRNVRQLTELQNWAWGRGHDESDKGVAGRHRSLTQQIDDIEESLSDMEAEHRKQYKELSENVEKNRQFFTMTIDNLTDTLNDEVDVDLDKENIEPDIVDD